LSPALPLGLRTFAGMYYELTETMVVTDPHGLHMRRCKDLIQVARKYITYRVFVRYPSAGGKSWANARSILSLQTLGVRGPVNGEEPPVVEVKVYGFRPRVVLQEIRKVLEGEPHKYLSIYEKHDLAQKLGGQLVVKPPAEETASPATGVGDLVDRIVSWTGSLLAPKPDAPGAAEGPSGSSHSETPDR
jgi:phosphotransferase system HPr-like phosphotransfer protein